MKVHNHKLKEILEGFNFEDNEEAEDMTSFGQNASKGSKAHTTKASHKHIDDSGNFS